MLFERFKALFIFIAIRLKMSTWCVNQFFKSQAKKMTNAQHTRPRLTQERLTAVLYYDEFTGVFTRRLSRGNLYQQGDTAGRSTFYGYSVISVDGVEYLAHRLAWLYVHGSWPIEDIDHINGVRTDNFISNLRDVSPTINMQNRRKCSRNNRCGVLGVCWHKATKKWRACIRFGGRQKSLGYFHTVADAYEARKAAELLYYPEKPQLLAKTV